MTQPPWKTVWWSLTNLNILLPSDPVIALLGIDTQELTIYVHVKNL